ncbi:hypothetical protein J7400_18990 [Shimia sp. R9_2]|uniref:ribosome modulation factor n=1 Tax=Shimia sp. R9_2 TaxID=2821112 RepID=UPI001ADC5A0E|nr:Rmf/CrpP family protein [Shimia sp. R9_2]MBO9398764.1 hypothetical protein [Shimia sp. R9_2]
MNEQVSHLPDHVAAPAPRFMENAKHNKGAIAALVPESLEDVFRTSKALAGAGQMVPDHFRGNPDMIMAAIMRGMEIGLAPMQALSNIAVINGRACIWGDALPAMMQRAGHHIDVVVEGEGDDMKAIATLERGDTGKVITREFSIRDAQKANLTGKKGPWQQYPKRMLMHRARSWAVRDGAADALMGLQIKEEVEDYQPMRDVTPAPATGTFATRAEAARTQPEAPALEQQQTVDPIQQEEREPEPAETAQEGQEQTFDRSALEPHWTDEYSADDGFPGSDEFNAGALAFEQGQPVTDCPHQEEPQSASDWIGGWKQAQKAAS